MASRDWYYAVRRGKKWVIDYVSDEDLADEGYPTGPDGARRYANDNFRNGWSGPYLSKGEAQEEASRLSRGGSEEDVGHDYADRKIEELTNTFRKMYAQAEREMRERLTSMMGQFAKENESWKARVSSGEETQERYEQWKRGKASEQMYVGTLADMLAIEATNANQRAMDAINDSIPYVFSENANYAAYGIERSIGRNTHSFDLYDQDTIRRLATEQPDLLPPLPKPRVDKGKDIRWNKQKFSSAIAQSILQGESIPNAAKRIGRVVGANEVAATRAARTAITGAENAGRINSYKRAERIGIKLEQEWIATFDERTRLSHRELHGQHVPVGGYFVASKTTGNRLLFPADPTADPSEVYNCRCTLVAWFPDIEQEEKPLWTNFEDGTTYEEWKAGRVHGELPSEDELRKRIDELNNTIRERSRLPITYSDKSDLVDSLQKEDDKLLKELDEYAWAADLDEDELERESMRRYDEYDRRFQELTERQNRLSWFDPEYEAIDKEKDALLEWLDEIDNKIDGVRHYKLAKSRYERVHEDLLYWRNQKQAERETAIRNRESLESAIRERNGAIAALSERQGFARNVVDTCGQDFADGIQARIESAKERHPDIARMYERFSSQFIVTTKDEDDGAFYSWNDRGIHFNLEEDKRGDVIHVSYGVALHEFAHLIDHASAYGYKTVSQSAGLQSVIKKDWTRFVNSEARKLGVTGAKANKNSAVIGMLRSEMVSMGAAGRRAFSDVSDQIEGCAQVDYPLGAGHGVSYHRQRSHEYTGLEFFAEACAAAMSNEDSYAQMRRIFPNAVDLVERIAKEMF